MFAFHKFAKRKIFSTYPQSFHGFLLTASYMGILSYISGEKETWRRGQANECDH